MTADKPTGGQYGGWVDDLVARFERRFQEMRRGHNFDLGVEFEIALCDVLQSVLPHGIGICRGYIVSREGRPEGDDIIIYDATVFPTLRGLGGNLGLKERVPAEGVLGYIEAKHTLYVDDVAHPKQSFAKVARQLAAVRSLRMEPPMYSVVFANRLQGREEDQRPLPEQLQLEIAAHARDPHLPDVIVAGDVLMLPAHVRKNEGRVELAPRATRTTELLFITTPKARGFALLHMLWVLQSERFPEVAGRSRTRIAWDELLAAEIQEAGPFEAHTSTYKPPQEQEAAVDTNS